MATNTTDNNIKFYRGDDISFNMAFTGEDEITPLDITGWTVFFTIKNNKSDPDKKAVLQKEFINFAAPQNGIAPIIVSKTETDGFKGSYYYDFQVKRLDGTILTISSGSITFIEDITRRTV